MMSHSMRMKVIPNDMVDEWEFEIVEDDDWEKNY